MRCYTCGFSNAEGNKVCEKCGTKLNAQAPAVAVAPPKNQAQKTQMEGIPTMRGTNSQQPAWDLDTDEKLRCVACGHYPLRSKVSMESPCPNCGTTGEKKDKPVTNGTMSFSNLIFATSAAAPTTPKVTLVDIATNKAVEFEGEDVVLNRANLNPSDQSISSGQHVQLVKEKGTWHVSDLSSNHATFIQVTDKVAVEAGTHILIGNRIYRIELD
ncbi:hypothetical protein GCM10023188_34620 [Pontibacter saemangeumensis]|uniref:FHA domain-containing protein n=1 Tax=Pontibacter saemangeumensis TaxID=1084525 RepID=A0ABP8LYL2_9BACT